MDGAGVRRGEAHDAAGEGGLAGARGAGECHGGAGGDFEIDAIEGGDGAAVAGEAFAQAVELQQRVSHLG
jgi:hypothetical protein